MARLSAFINLKCSSQRSLLMPLNTSCCSALNLRIVWHSSCSSFLRKIRKCVNWLTADSSLSVCQHFSNFSCFWSCGWTLFQQIKQTPHWINKKRYKVLVQIINTNYYANYDWKTEPLAYDPNDLTVGCFTVFIRMKAWGTKSLSGGWFFITEPVYLLVWNLKI